MNFPTEDTLEKGFVKGKLFPAIILLIVVLIFLSVFVIVAYKWNNNANDKDNDDTEEKNITEETKKENSINENSARCLELGCPENSIYVGSVNSDKYYECTCHYANRIHPENIICFSSKEEAENTGYIFTEC